MAYFSLPKLSYVDTVNLVYFAGAGPYQIERGLDLEEAKAAIAQELGLPPYRVVQNIHATNYPLVEVERELRRAWPRVLFRYPKALVKAGCLSFGKAVVSHNSALLADLTGQSWSHPNAEDMIRLRGAAFRRLAQNTTPLTVAFLWELAHALLSVAFACIGIISSLQPRAGRTIALLCFMILGDFALTIPLFGLEAYHRCRMPMLPFVALFAGFGPTDWLRSCSGAMPSRGAGRAAIDMRPWSDVAAPAVPVPTPSVLPVFWYFRDTRGDESWCRRALSTSRLSDSSPTFESRSACGADASRSSVR